MMASLKAEKKIQVVAYLADWSPWQGENLSINKITRLNYAFSLISNNVTQYQHLKKLNWIKRFKEINPKLETFISIGGWGADGFSDAAHSEISRKQFAESAVSLILNYGFDGIDLDWEYPCRDFANIKARTEDRVNFTKLIQTIRDTLDFQSEKTDKYTPITIAAGAAKIFADDMELDKLNKLLDTINLMTYDFYTTGEKIGHHTNLFPSSYYKSTSAFDAIETYKQAGIPEEKLILGAAFYGRSWTNLTPNIFPFEQSGISASSYTYSRLKQEIIDKGSFLRYWDKNAQAPYLFDGNTFITYDDPESIVCKAKFVKEQNLGGIMFWEWSEDHQDELLDSIVTTIS